MAIFTSYLSSAINFLSFVGLPQTSIKMTTVGAPLGCIIQHPPYIDGENRYFSINSNGGGGVRNFSVHLPLSYDHTIPHPLTISYHGGNETMQVQQQITNFSWNATNPNMIAVYPQGIGVSNIPTSYILSCYTD